MPRYISFEDVRLRLIGKVRFTEDEADENKMNSSLVRRLIDESESEVELDLSVRYFVPFQGYNGESFSTLKSNSEYFGAWNIIKTLCELKAVSRVLETDFGSGTTVDASKYIAKIDARYDKILNDRVLKKRTTDGSEDQQWFHPPLKGLRSAVHNSQADDGYIGMVLDSSRGDGGYPAIQINDPSENWWNGVLDES